MARVRTKRARVVMVIVVVAVVLVLGFAVLTLRLFVYPDLNAPTRSDAIVVLGGNGVTSFDEGLTLARQGYAPTLAVSVDPWSSCEPSAVHLPKERIVCFQPNPLTTQGEARAIAHLATRYHWHRVIVVMRRTQATRARLRIGWCYPGQVLEVGVSPSGASAWAYQIAYEWGALMKALVLERGC